MTRACCPHCRLRYSPATAAHLSACPFCGRALDLLPPEAALGCRLLALRGSSVRDDEIDALAAAASEDEPLE
jgi:hypothetical protein